MSNYFFSVFLLLLLGLLLLLLGLLLVLLDLLSFDCPVNCLVIALPHW